MIGVSPIGIFGAGGRFFCGHARAGWSGDLRQRACWRRHSMTLGGRHRPRERAPSSHASHESLRLSRGLYTGSLCVGLGSARSGGAGANCGGDDGAPFRLRGGGGRTKESELAGVERTQREHTAVIGILPRRSPSKTIVDCCSVRHNPARSPSHRRTAHLKSGRRAGVSCCFPPRRPPPPAQGAPGDTLTFC